MPFQVLIVSAGEHRGDHRGGGRGGGQSAGRGSYGGGAAGGDREKPKKENILDLGKYMDKKICVKFTGGREGMLPSSNCNGGFWGGWMEYIQGIGVMLEAWSERAKDQEYKC